MRCTASSASFVRLTNVWAGDAESAFASCRHVEAHGLGGNGPNETVSRSGYGRRRGRPLSPSLFLAMGRGPGRGAATGSACLIDFLCDESDQPLADAVEAFIVSSSLLALTPTLSP